MSKYFEDTMTGLLQAVAIEKGYMPLEEVLNMPAKTYRVSENRISIISPADKEEKKATRVMVN